MKIVSFCSNVVLLLCQSLLIFFNITDLQVTKPRVCKPALFHACPKPGQTGRVAAERAFSVKWTDGGDTGIEAGRLTIKSQAYIKLVFSDQNNSKYLSYI